MIKPGRSKTAKSGKPTPNMTSGVLKSVQRSEVADPRDSQKRILAAARMEFIERGFSGARMRPIAQRAQVNSALLHYYYRNKESLYQAALLDIVHSIWGSLETEAKQVQVQVDLPDMLRTLLRKYLEVVLVSPEFPRFILREILDGGKHLPLVFGTIQNRYGFLIQGIARGLENEIARGRFRSISLQDFLLNLGGMVISSILFALTSQNFPVTAMSPTLFDAKEREKRIDEIIRTLFDGLRKPS